MRTEKLEMILTHPKSKITNQITANLPSSSHPVLFLSTKMLGHLISCGKGLLSSAASKGSPVNCPNLGWHRSKQKQTKTKNSFRIRVCSISTYWFTTKLEYKSIDKHTSPIDLMGIDCNKLLVWSTSKARFLVSLVLPHVSWILRGHSLYRQEITDPTWRIHPP